MNVLSALLEKWETWSRSAEQSEDGWESDYPEWKNLMKAALDQMKLSPDARSVEMVAKCWAMSEESEELADEAKANNDEYWPFLELLASSPDPRVRWQIFSTISRPDEKGLELVRRGLTDSDQYVKRRALLALAELQAPECGDLARKLCYDDDPYIRQASLILAKASGDHELIDEVRAKLSCDPVDHVRRPTDPTRWRARRR